jgi:hypothetical protein
MPAFLPVQPPPLQHPPYHPPQLPAATQLPAVAPATGSEFETDDLFTLKSNTKATSFGTCWFARKKFGEPDATSDDIYITPGTNNSDRLFMIPNSTEVTVLANVQLKFVAYIPSTSAVKLKPTLGFQHTISNIKPHKANNQALNTLHKARIKAYNSGAQPAHA